MKKNIEEIHTKSLNKATLHHSLHEPTRNKLHLTENKANKFQTFTQDNIPNTLPHDISWPWFVNS